MISVKNAIIMAAGTSSRFAPISFEKPKALVEVRGEVLIERQIKQLKDAGISSIYVVVGYMSNQFSYLSEKFDVKLVYNSEFNTRNNNGSIWAVRDVLSDSFVCSADNYFTKNPFECEVEESYYAAEYSEGRTAEWCMTEDSLGYIDSVTIGGENAWYMMGHTFWSADFSRKFLGILEKEYELPETKGKLWESIFMDHLNDLKMRIRKYDRDIIFEFDSLDELRIFDESYVDNSKSKIIQKISKSLKVQERDICRFKCIVGTENEAIGFRFYCPLGDYNYYYKTGLLEKQV